MSGEATRDFTAIAREFFTEPSPDWCAVLSSTESVDFGSAGARRGAAYKRQITLHNHANAKVLVSWSLPESADADDIPDFAVSPASADINAGESRVFEIVFRPTCVDTYYSQRLEAFAMFKTQRTFRLSQDSTVSPPWAISITCNGHTFSDGGFAAQLAANVSGTLTFPGCHAGDAVYQTIKLTNQSSNLPAYFEMPEGSPDGAWRVKPACGLIAPSGEALVMVTF